jgi:NAD-dependent dihydropyrimidine dehydrogenase PreA subunit
MPRKVTDTCIQCGACINECPVGAITMGDSQSEIDPATCIDCGSCQAVCPVEAIIEE